VRDKIAVAAILCFFVYMILQFRYHYSEQFLAWLQRKISQHHFHIHVPPNIVAELFLAGMAAVILIAGYRYARNSIQREKALAWRFYDAGWACLALLFGALLLQVDLDSILYRAGEARPFPVWESYLLEVSLCGGMVLLAAGRITEVVQRRRIFKRELGRPPRWQLGIWLSICATWVGAFLAIGAAGTVGTMWQRTNSPESEIGPTPLWWFITAAVITGLAIIVTIVLLIIRYGRLTKDALDLATARHARATADNVREGTELPVATLDED
jgi:TRAP-type C4-dicarboxylate transport system permease small subunit